MDRNEVEIRVPIGLLEAELPAWVKLVWIAIRGFQGRNNSAWASPKTIGEQIKNEKGNHMKREQVYRGINKLVEKGFLVVNAPRNYSCILPVNCNPQLQICNPQLQICNPQLQNDDPQLHIKPKVKPKTKTNKKTKGSKAFSPDSWQYQISAEHFGMLKALQIAPRLALQNEEKTIQTGAAIFDKLERLDGHTKKEIDLVLDWLLRPECWWIRTGNYASATKLRDKKGDQTYFEKFLIEARQKNGKTKAGTDGNSTYSPVSNYARIHSIAEAALNTEQGSMGSTGTD